MKLLKRLIREDDGAGIVEYALLVAGIALVAIFGIYAFGDAVSEMFNNLATTLETDPN